MTLFALYLTCALVAGALAIWRTPRLPRYTLLLAIATVPQVGSVAGIDVPGMFLVSAGAVLAWAIANRTLPGVAVVGAGVLLNMVVMGLHGGAMPIRADILAAIGQVVEPGTRLVGSKDVVVETTVLWLLSDWLTVRSELITIVASPGDLVVVAGLLIWLIFSHQPERDASVLTLRAGPMPLDNSARLLHGQSSRPALTRLALLAAANPTVAETLLHDPLGAAVSHPHYALLLDDRDRETLDDLRSRSRTVSEFLAGLADVVDGAA